MSIQLLPFSQQFAGWRGAFMILALGPVFGIAAMLRLRGRAESVKLAGGRG